MGSLSCHGYLIDELWLLSSSACFVNRTTTNKTTSDANGQQKTAASSGWTAEISYEHYGNAHDDDDGNRSISIGGPSNRRNIDEILMQAGQEEPHSGSPIVLAKLEEPVRFR